LILLIWCVGFAPLRVPSQIVSADQTTSSDTSLTNLSASQEDDFRVEKVAVAGGAEIVTVLARKKESENTQGPVTDLPMISILRDTLGDERPENDRLRYVWLHSYTRPSLTQKISAVVPFLYSRTTNKDKVGSEPPPEVIDLQKSDKNVWNKVFWTLFQKPGLG